MSKEEWDELWNQKAWMLEEGILHIHIRGWLWEIKDFVDKILVSTKQSEKEEGEPKRATRLYSISPESEAIVRATYEEFWPEIEKAIEEAKKKKEES